MKTQLIYSAILAATVVALPSCDDKKPASTPGQDTAPQTAAVVEPEQPAVPDEAAIGTAIASQLTDYPWVEATLLSLESAPDEEGALRLTARIKVSYKENLYQKAAAPEAFNEERKAINESANAAMKPESAYLLQIGAPANMITENDRVAKPLPENLQQLADELRDLSESAVYTLAIPAGEETEITGTLKATLTSDNTWETSDVAIQTAALPSPGSVCAESALPEGAAVLTPEFESARKAEIQQKIEAFNAAAAPYINSREETARAAYTEHQARLDEEARKTAEAATAAAAEKEAWINFCTATIASGKKFAGEWTRGNRFGEISVAITKAEKFENSVQFIGTIYDTKLPEASLDISGRCELTKNEDGTSRVDITIYDGQYDPDQPTAEVYDARDGMLVLTLNGEGKLSGVMTCASWAETPEKDFQVSLTPKNDPPAPARRRR